MTIDDDGKLQKEHCLSLKEKGLQRTKTKPGPRGEQGLGLNPSPPSQMRDTL